MVGAMAVVVRELDDRENDVGRREYRISSRVTVMVAAPATQPFTSMKRR